MQMYLACKSKHITKIIIVIKKRVLDNLVPRAFPFFFRKSIGDEVKYPGYTF